MKDMITFMDKEIARLAGQAQEMYTKEFPMTDRTAEMVKRVLDQMSAMDNRKRMIEQYVFPNGEFPEPPPREGIDNATFTEV